MKPAVTWISLIVSGVLMALAFPPFGFSFLAYVGFIPLLNMARVHKPPKVFLYSWISGMVFLAITISWIRHITFVGMILAIIVLAIFYAVPFYISSLIMKRWPGMGLVLFPFAVAAIEWVRSFDQLAFPWMCIGNSQAAYPQLIQFADITSVYGVSAWVAAINIMIYLLIRKRTIMRGGLLAVFFVLPALYGTLTKNLEIDGAEPISVALIQGNVTPEEKWADGMEIWNINLYRSMSVESLQYAPDLIVWPETAVPVYLADIPHYTRMVQGLVDSTRVPIITGMPAIDFQTYDTWNAAGLFVPDSREIQQYDKIHLVPFGEAFPMDGIFPALKRIDFGQANWNEGSETVVFQTPDLPPFNTAICFESIFPDLMRKFIVKDSRFIVVITNDVWFGPLVSPIQHAMISVLRAIEFHRPVIRCANTGISMIIDADGRVLKRTDTFTRTILSGSIVPSETMTFYARYGNVFSIFSFILTLSACIIYIVDTHRFIFKRSI